MRRYDLEEKYEYDWRATYQVPSEIEFRESSYKKI